MASPFDTCEADFFGDLKFDTHGLWEVFEFVRLHFPEASEAQVLEKGRVYIARWIRSGWIQIAAKPLYPTTVSSLAALPEFLEQHGAAATYYLENAPSFDITEEAERVYESNHLTHRCS
jgi:hypothetical protein